MNDNSRESVIATVLSTTAVVELMLTRELPTLLAEAGFTTEFQEIVRGFLAPAIAMLNDMENKLIDHLRQPERSPIDDRAEHLDAWAETFTRLASSPSQMRAARGFREFVDELTGKEAEKRKEPAKDKDFERE